MDSSEPLRPVEPRPLSPSRASSQAPQQYGPQPYQPQPYEPQPYEPQAYPPHTTSAPQLGLRLGPESQIPDHPSSMMDVPRPSNNYGQMTASMPAPTDVRQLKTQCQFNLREYQALQRQRQRPDAASTMSVELDGRLRAQQNIVLANLRMLQDEVKVMVKEAENHRWRKWLLGGAVASFIPLVRRIFRRSSDDEESLQSANDTEYAFKRSRGLLRRIRDTIFGRGRLVSIAFFVFAIMYVFQNEVTLRVAKTIQKRVRKLTARIERGDPSVDDKDIKMLDGWRWRVLLW